MTLVKVKVSVPEVLGLEPAGGAIRWTPTKRRLAGDTVVMPKGFSVPLVNGEADIELSPTSPDWVWRVDEQVPGATNKSLYLAVPDLAEVEYTALIEVDPATLVPTEDPDPAWYAYVDTLAAQATTASASAVAAKVAAEAAELSATGSETSAAASAATATTKASEANTSATNAATSATTALGHKNDAAESAGAAANSETAAADSATSANLSAIAAAGSDTHATAMADIAQSSASDTIAAANGFSIGTVTTGAPGDPATATITGTAPDKRLNLGLPKGETGPANSLSVLTTTTGPETAGATGPQGVKGDKGDPGGWVAATGLAGSPDLNTITTPGTYRNLDNTLATSALNYPLNGIAINLAVIATSPSIVTQIAYPINGAYGSRMMYVRSFNATWTPWRAFNSTRVDVTAGRVFYQWNHDTNVEQLVYGDTGLRNVTALMNTTYYDNTGVSRVVHVRRVGYMVTVTGQFLSSAAAPAAAIALSLPSGFRSQSLVEAVCTQIRGTSALIRVIMTAGSGDVLLQPITGSALGNPAAGDVFNIGFSYPTSDAWPTTLPGTANGSIPNL